MAERHIVFATVGSQGDLFPLLAVGRELVSRGHRVTVGAHAIHRDAVLDAGLDFVMASGIDEPEDKAAFAAKAFHPWKGPRFVVRDLAAADVAASYHALKTFCREADAVVTTTLAFAGQILGETLRVAWLSAVLSPSVFLSPFDPPATGIDGLDRWLRASPRRARWLTRAVERLTYPWTAPVRAFRSRLGLAPIAFAGDPFHRGQHGRDGVLAMYSPLLGGLPPDAPANTVLTGQARYLPFDDVLDGALLRWLDAGTPPIVFTLGSAAVHASEGFLRESVDAARRLGCRAVLLTGSPALRERLAIKDDNVFAADYAPHGALFARAAVVVHHGGVGTTQESMRAGRPSLVVPHGFDQPDNAARVKRLGVGEVLPATRYRADRAAAKLALLLEDAPLRARAEEVARRMKQEQGARVAADVIEAAIERRSV
ncbi:glycosyltransferase [Luteibacter aegosomatissinici]|uniref:glycosyltransferase n=1 Tax=Luteibacter aegosomatissinici TaxID=2911539 RepID=UPI001FF95C0E|nr:glycosyltransferase [Luteibacter aegosomatissinici]UPG95144.1 glycosyltransferase [Luteibacter aegosomatissinici]